MHETARRLLMLPLLGVLAFGTTGCDDDDPSPTDIVSPFPIPSGPRTDTPPDGPPEVYAVYPRDRHDDPLYPQSGYYPMAPNEPSETEAKSREEFTRARASITTAGGEFEQDEDRRIFDGGYYSTNYKIGVDFILDEVGTYYSLWEAENDHNGDYVPDRDEVTTIAWFDISMPLTEDPDGNREASGETSTQIGAPSPFYIPPPPCFGDGSGGPEDPPCDEGGGGEPTPTPPSVRGPYTLTASGGPYFRVDGYGQELSRRELRRLARAQTAEGLDHIASIIDEAYGVDIRDLDRLLGGKPSDESFSGSGSALLSLLAEVRPAAVVYDAAHGLPTITESDSVPFPDGRSAGQQDISLTELIDDVVAHYNAVKNAPQESREAARTPAPQALRAAPVAFAVYPNPSPTGVTVRFEAEAAGRATLEVRDVQGRLVHSANADVAPGENALRWDGTAGGSRVAAGTYVGRLEAPGVSATRTFTLL